MVTAHLGNCFCCANNRVRALLARNEKEFMKLSARNAMQCYACDETSKERSPQLHLGTEVQALADYSQGGKEYYKAGDMGIVTELYAGDDRIIIRWARTELATDESKRSWTRWLKVV